MKSKSIDNYSVYADSTVKILKMGNITEIKSLLKSNKTSSIKRINKDEFVYLETGEIFKINHYENRGENIEGIRRSISVLRNIINNNFVGSDKELFITLTFDKNKIYKPDELSPVFEKFIKRLRYKLIGHKIDYIYIPEPHEKGDWHIHLLLKSDKCLYISNKELSSVWQNGFVKVNRLKNVDNVGAYVSAYLTNIKNGEETKKGARLYLYPSQHKLYRCSKGIIKPVEEELTYRQAKEFVKNHSLTYTSTIKIDNEKGFTNIIHKEYYNKKTEC